ncbi:hypothetical protein Pla110_21550 [Polystyrenella longa]|uniref:3-keto-alpha-glucoside-1,2-lyase/3-keto-2-hydroxy-glucal hydratase domain-containing protein n=1 Tax=Polystyrenella longa TaxID=2528007 RepID=A0A518CMH1_9PLAN|nr:DUF1080 domain-containing protein [Polystyrenella longa]QDU80425.1 hypothetical protein Pla110_21550 [Polystyrenella longa]
MKHLFLSLTLVLAAVAGGVAEEKEEGWISLFNGKDLSGWKVSENGTWTVADGMIKAHGDRTHLFTDQEFKNFEFKAEVMTTPGSNSGIYFHTKYCETWPTEGYETQVNVTHGDPVKTGSLYNVIKLFDTPAEDNKWWTQTIIVNGDTVTVKVDDKVLYTYVEPAGTTGEYKAGDVIGHRKISQGSFALQQHDPKSVTYFRNIRVKPLAD